ncbi:MAG: hypothetical protein J2P19_25190 [Pseudonocardia sp.]|nr:hypothetical protein [Pseudonocardia sp.]
MTLKSNHARAISTTLAKIEKDIIEIETQIRSPPRGRMYEVVDDLSDSRRERLLAKIALLKVYIQEFADELDLRSDRTNISAIIGGKLAIDWANSCDIQPEKLKAYGAVDQEVARAINPHVERLMRILS